MGRATQGVRLINLEKRNDEIASVCKVDTTEIEETDNNSEIKNGVEIEQETPSSENDNKEININN